MIIDAPPSNCSNLHVQFLLSFVYYHSSVTRLYKTKVTTFLMIQCKIFHQIKCTQFCKRTLNCKTEGVIEKPEKILTCLRKTFPKLRNLLNFFFHFKPEKKSILSSQKETEKKRINKNSMKTNIKEKLIFYAILFITNITQWNFRFRNRTLDRMLNNWKSDFWAWTKFQILNSNFQIL